VGNDSIDKSSAEYLFAQVITRLDSGDKSFKEVKGRLDDVRVQQAEIGASIKGLPCNHHVALLREMKQWQDDHDARIERERMKAKERTMSLRQAIIIIVVTGIVTSLFGYALQFLPATGRIAAGG